MQILRLPILDAKSTLINTFRIAELLEPFLRENSLGRPGATISNLQLEQIAKYVDFLERWNQRVNLTAIRDPEEIITRHFGESFFAARHVFGDSSNNTSSSEVTHLVDVGSGAGFPGLPVKIWNPDAAVTLIESSQKKATFLREVIRALSLKDVEVFAARAEQFATGQANIVTLRAVEQFQNALPTAIGLLAREGRIALLIGESQTETARGAGPNIEWEKPLPVPLSVNRCLLLGTLR